jgi:hypothetical protein
MFIFLRVYTIYSVENKFFYFYQLTVYLFT